LIALLDPKVWLVALLLCLASYCTGRWQQHSADQAAQAVAVAQANADARERERLAQKAVNKSKEIRDAEFETINSRLVAAVSELRRRAVRLPEAARAACKGATGAELSNPDGRFLAGEAARADKLRAALAECQAYADTLGPPEPSGFKGFKLPLAN
jgi:hypothetical protein